MKKTKAKDPTKRGKIVIDRERCKGCQLCRITCPQGAISLSEDFNEKGYHFAIFDDGKKCTGCALCGRTCPDMAIDVFR